MRTTSTTDLTEPTWCRGPVYQFHKRALTLIASGHPWLCNIWICSMSLLPLLWPPSRAARATWHLQRADSFSRTHIRSSVEQVRAHAQPLLDPPARCSSLVSVGVGAGAEK